jgi:hypothetical protein
MAPALFGSQTSEYPPDPRHEKTVPTSQPMRIAADHVKTALKGGLHSEELHEARVFEHLTSDAVSSMVRENPGRSRDSDGIHP